MSSSRVTVSGALLVCSVDSTRCPVSDASIAICAVSRLWHTIAMNTPAVWANIILGPDWGLGPDAFLRKCDVFLERSQQTPLFLDLDFYFADAPDTAQAIVAAVAASSRLCPFFVGAARAEHCQPRRWQCRWPGR